MLIFLFLSIIQGLPYIHKHTTEKLWRAFDSCKNDFHVFVELVFLKDYLQKFLSAALVSTSPTAPAMTVWR